ncbi:class I SAM-dependent DNA methyltransferase [Nevskia ramosa]|uniref:class I SAM-dependent DNA methyltransferase n=1 Tax=Nevskia ramosa TaxID=64002 RepID=UPI003D150BAB
MTPSDFIAKWKNGGDERRDSQPFFEDLCRLLGHATPRETDPDHTHFTYEYGAAKTSGGNGWADVWKKGHFGLEFKGTHKDLDAAYTQLKNYADALENPPLLIVCDLVRFRIHTNFTSTVSKRYEFTVSDLDKFETRQLLDAAFRDPERLRPSVTRAIVTQEAADRFTDLATALRKREPDAHHVAHFLNRLIFCMFAEDIGLLPSHIFTELVENSLSYPERFAPRASALFVAMHKGGDLNFKNIEWFNGGLFDDDRAIALTGEELRLLLIACKLDWSEIEPSIFGTLFERGLDPGKRGQLGAHYTDPTTIMKIVGPVIVEPLLAEWEAEKAELAKQIDKAKRTVSKAAQTRFNSFLERLRAFTVLDPACGSGNFLYVALRALKDLEKRILIEAEAMGLPRQFPGIGPQAVKGIEINDYAAELARVTIWIGEIQWMRQNGFSMSKNPILKPLDQIECRDALLNADGSEATWPLADVIVGNPPFLGDKKMIGELGEIYVETLRKTYSGRVAGGADFVCYWFEKARLSIESADLQRAGLVATNSIRGGKNREVLKAICERGRIFNAWSDESWINEGAAVRVSLIAFGNSHSAAELDGFPAGRIFADLTSAGEHSNADLTLAMPIQENRGSCFQGSVKVGNFDITGESARIWLMQPNAIGGKNSEVLRPLLNAKDITTRQRGVWIVDFASKSVTEAAGYEHPFGHVEKFVKPYRSENRDQSRRENWWLHGRVGTDIRRAVVGLDRVIVSPRVSKHRLFIWVSPRIYCDDATVTIARSDDTFFGILHSRFHEIWSLRMCTYLGVGNDPRYTPTTCFETFPFPHGLTPNIPAADYAIDPRAVRIAAAAVALNETRERWLNPPEWTYRVPEVVAGYPDRIIAKPGFEADLKKRTLTNLYNERPAWLNNLHIALDEAVAAAYGWEWPLADDEILSRLFVLNQARIAG